MTGARKLTLTYNCYSNSLAARSWQLELIGRMLGNVRHSSWWPGVRKYLKLQLTTGHVASVSNRQVVILLVHVRTVDVIRRPLIVIRRPLIVIHRPPVG